VIARQVVDAANVGVPLATWQAYTMAQRAAIIAEHNARHTRK
jgi:orotate phosphoribosyltransferase-like protein